jgi:predicted AlkP superfamily pyrophosphatase or phosphodiesterase
MPQKLIVYMIDGVAADHYQSDRRRFPHFAALEARGFCIESLHAEALGTSLPGRTSMLTGATADVSGVYGNKIWDGERDFRYAGPDDIRVPTIPQLVKAEGKRVASINAGMIRAEDADMMVAPWWIEGEMIQRARDVAPTTSGASWQRVATAPRHPAFLAACAEAGLPTSFPNGLDRQNPATFPLYALMADLLAADWVGALAASAHAPELIWAEFLMTDTLQHYNGYKSELGHFSVDQADMALGRIMQRLANAGVADEWTIAVMSDHGHSHIETALHPQVIIPGVTVQCEGGSLLVAPKDQAELRMVEEKLAAYGVEAFPNDCVPAEYREQIYVFVAPHQTSFEGDNPHETEPTGKPKAISTHGLKPGWAGDHRFALFAGPGVPQGNLAAATATQVAPTLAMLLGLPVAQFHAQPIFGN